MPDTRIVEGGDEWPRRYTVAELEKIASAAGVTTCGPVALEKLQRAVERYQWATSGDEGGIFFRSYTETREQLYNVLKLIRARASVEEIDSELNELDAITSQLIGAVRADNPRHLERAVRRALGKVQRRGPDPKRARRQFIQELYNIFAYATGGQPTRRVHDREYGPFPEFVKTALNPFNAAMGCEADIKVVLQQRRESRK